MQNIFRVDREEGGRAAHKNGKQVEGDCSQNDSAGENEAEPHDQTPQGHGLFYEIALSGAHQADEHQTKKGRGCVCRVNRRCVMGPGDYGAAKRRPSN